jgi:M6 family metalloprotease-like protein
MTALSFADWKSVPCGLQNNFTMMGRFLRLAVIVIALTTSSAAPANPLGRIYDQPDGSTTPELFLKGDEQYSWMADKMGYSVMQDDQGWWVYAKKVDGSLVSAGVRVGFGNPKKLGLATYLKDDPSKRINNLRNDHEAATKEHRNLLQVPSSALCNFQGTASNPCRLKGLVLLIRFADHNRRVLPAPEEYDILFNHNGPTADGTAPTGSVSDVFRDNSYGSFVLESHVTDWIQVSRTEAQTVDGNNGLNMPGTKATWREAMERLQGTGVDLRQFDQDGDQVFDCLVVMHSGAAAETGGIDCEANKGSNDRIWSHATADTWFTSTSGISNFRFYVASGVWDTCPPGGAGAKWANARIAVIAHECAHFLGLPDTYNSDGNGGSGTFDLQGKSEKSPNTPNDNTFENVLTSLAQSTSEHVGMVWYSIDATTDECLLQVQARVGECHSHYFVRDLYTPPLVYE